MTFVLILRFVRLVGVFGFDGGFGFWVKVMWGVDLLLFLGCFDFLWRANGVSFISMFCLALGGRGYRIVEGIEVVGVFVFGRMFV